MQHLHIDYLCGKYARQKRREGVIRVEQWNKTNEKQKQANHMQGRHDAMDTTAEGKRRCVWCAGDIAIGTTDER